VFAFWFQILGLLDFPKGYYWILQMASASSSASRGHNLSHVDGQSQVKEELPDDIEELQNLLQVMDCYCLTLQYNKHIFTW
jgi:hypothetical protein